MSKIKNFFNKTKAGKIIRSVGLGVVDSVLPVKGIASGVVGGVKEAFEKNLLDEVTEEGQIDWIRISTFIALFGIIVFILIQLFSGAMTLEQVLKYFEELGLLDEI